MKTCACGCGTQIGEKSTWSRGHQKRGANGYQLAENRSGGKEFGSTGNVVFSGQFYDDINDDFNDRDIRLDRYEEMERTDTACQALKAVISLPIRSVKWWVEPASDSTQDKEIADSITWNLTEGMKESWDVFLQEALTCVTRGFSVFEKVFVKATEEEFSGKLRWSKFAFRHQRTIKEWRFDDVGDVSEANQQVEGDFSNDVWIPVEKMLVFTFRKEGSNLEGNSVYRACWKDYYYKQGLQRIEAIGLERFWIGTPVMKLPRSSTRDDKDVAFDIVSKIRGDEAAGVVIPDTWDFDILRVASEGGTMNDVISRYTRNIFLAGLAQFLALGDKAVGSWALSKDQSAFFLFALNAIANEIVAATINKEAIPQLVKLNWPKVNKYPKLIHDDLNQIDFGVFAENLGKLVQSGFLTGPDVSIEDQVREMMGLPELAEDVRKRKEEEMKNPPEPPVDEKEVDEKTGKKVDKKDKEPKKEKPEDEEEAQKLQEIDPALLEKVIISEGDIAQAIVDFNERAPPWQKGILEANMA